jgi:hypothetical protein
LNLSKKAGAKDSILSHMLLLVECYSSFIQTGGVHHGSCFLKAPFLHNGKGLTILCYFIYLKNNGLFTSFLDSWFHVKLGISGLMCLIRPLLYIQGSTFKRRGFEDGQNRSR